MAAPHPTSAVRGGRGGTRHVWDELREMRSQLSEADVTPLTSLCLNKSCSKSFYLHMLTGTSEFPEEKCREKNMHNKKKNHKNVETQRQRSLPATAAKGLSRFFFHRGIILIKLQLRFSLSYSYSHRKITGW